MTKWVLAAIILLGATDAQARDATQQAAPTQPVIIKSLDAPVFQSDTRNLEAIVDKDNEPQGDANAVVIAKRPESKIIMPPPPAAAPPPMPVRVNPDNAVIPKADKEEEESHGISTALMTLRIFIIRWSEVINAVLLTAIALFTWGLYRNSRHQSRMLARSLQAAEYEAARRSRQDIGNFTIL